MIRQQLARESVEAFNRADWPAVRDLLAPGFGYAEFRATLWQRRDGEKIADEHHHLDLLTMLVQLGALPAPASV